ncbi:MAG: hypothetical protein JEY79_16690 [Pseudodesulfovibrio sp.]|nr:hypothetical protein [Pseudodesulfovibrio sp.]
MIKYVISAIYALFLGIILCAPAAQADQTEAALAPVDVAIMAPGNANAPITGQNLPLYLDEDLASKHANFSNFAKGTIQSLNRNHHLSKSRMQIVKQSDGLYRARYHSIDSASLVCKVRRSKSKAIPYVGVLRYKERIFEAVAVSPEACRASEFIPVAIIPNRHIFSFKKGAWQ